MITPSGFQLFALEGTGRPTARQLALVNTERGLVFNNEGELVEAYQALFAYLALARRESQPSLPALAGWDMRVLAFADWITITLALEEARRRGAKSVTRLRVTKACVAKQIVGAHKFKDDRQTIWVFPRAAFVHWLERETASNDSTRPRKKR